MEARSLEIDSVTNDFVLRLPAPHDHIILTCPRLEDAKDILPILNHDQIYPWMGLPYPHHQEHALYWLKSVKSRCDSAQDDLRRSQGEVSTSFPSLSQCPVRIIRETKIGRESIYLGDCGIQRWNFCDVSDERQRQLLKNNNEKKTVGDPTIIWTIGYYLAPSHSGRGIMSAAVSTLIRWTFTNMNVQCIRTTAMEGNVPSIKVLERNGFVMEKTLQEFALKDGEKVGLHILDWKASSQV